MRNSLVLRSHVKKSANRRGSHRKLARPWRSCNPSEERPSGCYLSQGTRNQIKDERKENMKMNLGSDYW